MSYRPETILKRRKPFPKPNEGGLDLTPYNEVRVVGPALTHTDAPRPAGWEGSAGELWTVTPTSFGEVIDRPVGELEPDYEILSEPELPTKKPPEKPRPFVPGPSPEDVFRTADEASGLPKAKKRASTPMAAFAKTDEAATKVTARKPSNA